MRCPPSTAAWATPSSARTSSCPGRPTPASSTTSSSWPPSSAAPAATSAQPRPSITSSASPSGTTCRPPAARRELPVGMGPAKAKEWDGSNVLGPCIVTTDEIDLATLQLEVRINGERWGGDTTANMHHSFGDLLAYSAQDQTLRPSDVLGSG